MCASAKRAGRPHPPQLFLDTPGGADLIGGVISAQGGLELLGAGYGLCLSTEVEETAAPDELGAVASIFYSLAYAGLLVPYLLTFLAPRGGYPWALTAAATASGLTMVLVLVSRPGSGSAPDALPAHDDRSRHI